MIRVIIIMIPKNWSGATLTDVSKNQSLKLQKIFQVRIKYQRFNKLKYIILVKVGYMIIYRISYRYSTIMPYDMAQIYYSLIFKRKWIHQYRCSQDKFIYFT